MADEYNKGTQVESPQPVTYKTESKWDPKFLAKVAKQHTNEYELGLTHIRPWRDVRRVYLKLYANHRKNTKKVGDTLKFSTHQTILAAIYRDSQSQEWLPREEEDVDRVEQLNALAEFDYDQMRKAQHDFGKTFDATGPGIAIEDWSHFDRKSLTPIPVLWDWLSFVYDPAATSINGNRLGEGAMRFIYRDIVRTKQWMKDHGGFFDVDQLTKDEAKLGELKQNRDARDAATGLTSSSFKDLTENEYFAIRQGYTWIDGKRYLIEVGNEGCTVVRLQRLKRDYWPLQEYRVYPEPHGFLTPGCWDFTEDKQRARALLQNYGLDAAKYDVLPEWIFDKDRIVNKRQLQEHRAGKMIEGKGDVSGAIQPLQKPTIHQYVNVLMQDLEANAQKALATPDMKQGVLMEQKRLATEIVEVAAGAENRYSLTSSLFGQAEENAAMMWLDSYKDNYKSGVDKKTIRIVGAFGPELVPLEDDTFNFKADPDVKVESRAISQTRKRQERSNMVMFGQMLMQTPGSNMRSFVKDFGRLDFRKAVVDKYLPPTVDEMKAEDENEKLSKNTLEGVKIEATDDDQMHMEIHGKAADTKAKAAHIKAHRENMMIKRMNPELFAGIQIGPPTPAQAAGGQPTLPGTEPPPPSTPQGQVPGLIQ